METPKYCLCSHIEDPCTFPNCIEGQKRLERNKDAEPKKEEVLKGIKYDLAGWLTVPNLYDFFTIVSDDCPLFPEAESAEDSAKRFERAILTWLEKQ